MRAGTAAAALSRSQALRLLFGYAALYAFGFLSKPVDEIAAIWPSHAVGFAAFILLPVRRWVWAAIGVLLVDIALVPILQLTIGEPFTPVGQSLGFAGANLLTVAGPALLARWLDLFGGPDRPRMAISPLWIFVLFAGAAPGAFLGALVASRSGAAAVMPADVGLWDLASVLSIATFGPMVLGITLGFIEEARSSAKAWEGYCVTALMLTLFAWFAIVAWPAADEPVQSMLFAVPLAWLALRFSHRATSIAVAVVASGVVVLAAHRTVGTSLPTDLAWWRNIVISIDIFLLIGCGGALLINLMTLKQRALLEELEREHRHLRRYAQALDVAEEAARRATAADLHDGIGQVLAGQSMTLAAMRAHANPPKLAALVEEAVQASREAQEGLRLMIQDLSPPELEHATLEETLKWLVDLFKSRFGFTICYRVGGRADLSREQLRLLYRCVRELLMNACKHSRRASAEVDIDISATSVDICVIDEGVGFDTQAQRSATGRRFGLAQLRERVRTAGGSLAIESAVGEGCRATVRLPSPSRNPRSSPSAGDPAPEPAVN